MDYIKPAMGPSNGPRWAHRFAAYKTGRMMISHWSAKKWSGLHWIWKIMVFHHGMVQNFEMFCICCSPDGGMPEKKHERKSKHVFEVEWAQNWSSIWSEADGQQIWRVNLQKPRNPTVYSTKTIPKHEEENWETQVHNRTTRLKLTGVTLSHFHPIWLSHPLLYAIHVHTYTY